MRSATIILASLTGLAALTGPPSTNAAPLKGDAYHIVVPHRALRAGERVRYRIEPPPPADARVTHGVAVELGRDGRLSPVYQAPFVIPPGTPPARVSISFSGPTERFTASAEIELLPGSVAGAEDCLGPGQSFSTTSGTIEPDYIQLDELPEIIHRVEPDYPRSAYVRGVEDTLSVKLLVCRSGRVLDARVLARYRDRTSLEPVEQDPKLVEAAEAAALQFVCKPGRVSGQAVAVWVHTPIVFRR